MARRIGLGLIAGAVVGLQWGLVEVDHLRIGGVPISPRELVETLAFFAVSGATIAIAGIALAALALRDPRARAVVVLPGVVAALAFVGLFVNVRWLPSFLAPQSLAADVAMVGVAALAVAIACSPRLGARSAAVVLAAIAAANVVAWVRSAPAHAAPAMARHQVAEHAPNLFVILVDTLRADHLGTYGYERATSPRIDAFATQSVVLERAFSSTNWTRPAVASLLTSTMPSRHQVVSLDRTVSDALPLLGEALQSSGYQTGFFTVGSNVERSDGYGRGADTFYSVAARHPAGRSVFVTGFLAPFLPGVVDALPWSPKDPDAQADPFVITDHALAWVGDADPTRPVFAYIHYLGPHSPYRPPPAYDRFTRQPHRREFENPPSQWAGRDAVGPDERQAMIDLYDGEVLWNDAAIGKLLDGLRASGRLDHAVVAILADHGEAFGLNGVWGHNASMFRSVVRIPMLFWASDSIGLREPQRLGTPVSLIDVAPTLLDLASLPPEDGFDGETLAPWLRGQTDADRTVFIENPSNEELSVRTRDWSYFQGRTGSGAIEHWLFAAGDPLQQENRIAERPDLADELRTLAERRRARDLARATRAASIELDPARKKALQALGYVTE